MGTSFDSNESRKARETNGSVRQCNPHHVLSAACATQRHPSSKPECFQKARTHLTQTLSTMSGSDSSDIVWCSYVKTARDTRMPVLFSTAIDTYFHLSFLLRNGLFLAAVYVLKALQEGQQRGTGSLGGALIVHLSGATFPQA